MPAANFRTLTLTEVGNGEWRVDIVAADDADTARAQEMVSMAVRVQLAENPSLAEIRRKAVDRAKALLEECMTAVAPKASASHAP